MDELKKKLALSEREANIIIGALAHYREKMRSNGQAVINTAKYDIALNLALKLEEFTDRFPVDPDLG